MTSDADGYYASVTRPLRVLWTCLYVALVAFGSWLLPVPALETGAGVLLVFTVPGAFLLHLHPRRRDVPLIERVVWVVLVSLAANLLGGFALNLLASLTKEWWLVYSGATSVIACALVLLLGPHDPERALPGRPHVVTVTRHKEGSAIRDATFFAWLRSNVMATIVGLFAVGLVVIALLLAQLNTSATEEHFVDLSMLPNQSRTPGLLVSAMATIELTNYEGAREEFVVRLYNQKGDLLRSWTIRVDNTSTWRVRTSWRGAKSLRTTVSLVRDPANILDYVTLKS